MKRIITLMLLFITTYSFSQTNNSSIKLLTNDFIIHTSQLNELKEGDTLTLRPAKEPFVGMLSIDSDKTIYERGRIEKPGSKKNKYSRGYNKIGFWEIDEKEVVFNLTTRLITFKYLPIDPYIDGQILIVTSVKSM